MKFEGIEVAVVRKPVKNIRLSVLSDCTLRVVAPQDYDVSALLLEKKEWISAHLEKKRSLSLKYEENSSKMLFSGLYFSLNAGDYCSFDYENMAVTYPSVKEYKAFIKKRLKDDITTRLSDIAKDMGVCHAGFTIRKQKSRWASCSSRGALNFNLRIAALPPNLRDYIIIHELAHITEHNHSKNFWNIVRNFCPNYKSYRKELSEYWLMIENNHIWKTILE
ncbi:MAG: SprT family zinc-dependent metalloprotease [Methanomicrobium sp.]|nr:SprT family zinc-dependent metalloprotease [Methanomicrobium sp.]